MIQGLNDPAYVQSQYVDELGLRARKAAYGEVTGTDARDVVFEAVAEARARRVLEVGCGEGEFAQRLVRELGVDVIALDQSPRMVELAVAGGVDARLGDVEDLPFADGSFDLAVAAWMLYHLPDLDRGLAELARVLKAGGRLVAVTNYEDHLHEMFALVGITRWELTFGGENGAELLHRHFDRVDRRDANGTVTFNDADAVRSYLASSEQIAHYADRVPRFAKPLVARRRPVVFVAEKGT